jgi:hypothetical protein
VYRPEVGNTSISAAEPASFPADPLGRSLAGDWSADMTSGPPVPSLSSESGPRFRMKPQAPPTGVVDGGWWPRSPDLPEELTALLGELSEGLGGVERVSYNLTAWPGAPRRVQLHGRTVRLGGYHSQNPHSIDLVSGSGRVTTLLVIPFDAGAEAAEAALAAAADPDAAGPIDALLATAAPAASRTPR